MQSQLDILNPTEMGTPRWTAAREPDKLSTGPAWLRLEPALHGSGLFPCGAGLFPSGAGLFPSGAGLFPSGAGPNAFDQRSDFGDEEFEDFDDEDFDDDFDDDFEEEWEDDFDDEEDDDEEDDLDSSEDEFARRSQHADACWFV